MVVLAPEREPLCSWSSDDEAENEESEFFAPVKKPVWDPPVLSEYQLFFLYMAVCMSQSMYAMVVTILPALVVHDAWYPEGTTWDHKLFMSGFAVALFPLGQFLASPALGSMSQQYGRRGILLFAMGASVIALIVSVLGITIWNLNLLMVRLRLFCRVLS
jgi:MFS family permease